MTTVAFARGHLAAATSVVALVALAGCSGADEGSSDADVSRTTPASRLANPDTECEDGTYSAVGTYGGGPSYLDVTVTIDDEIITDGNAGTRATNETSLGYQERFAAAVPDEAIGKDLGEVIVGELAGSSTCADGFNDAIAQIREQALKGA